MALGRAVETLKTLTGSAERRAFDRFPLIGWNVFYELKKKRATGSGKTIDMSAGGILICTQSDLPPGQPIHLTVEWPVKLDGIIPLKLEILGRVVRSEKEQAAIEIVKYKFKTRRTGQKLTPNANGPRQSRRKRLA